ncbi:MAG TPA: ATP-binding protein [Methylibium sp.]|uniref:ATP-binding protein n=1 Tax=Methylibium sp. TaxID=2067992 RepID=UPI002DB5D073|nr:ATP-binding protein [Methylibium sp.]HEU4460901.1 ATP-binding protein [Methylibium sp.]
MNTLSGGGEMGAAMRAFDWSKTPLGPSADWPRSLKTVVRLMLDSRFAMWLAWGPELVFFCNDAYRPTLGSKRDFLGAPARQVWAEIWSEIGPRIEHVLHDGEATWDENLLLFLERRGYKEETYHSFSYSPVHGDAGAVEGMLCVVSEETERRLAERRLAMLAALSNATSSARSVAQAAAQVEGALAKARSDLPFVLLYLIDEATDTATLQFAQGLDGAAALPAAQSLRAVRGDGTAEWPLAEVRDGGRAATVDDVIERFGAQPAAPWPEAVARARVLPLARAGRQDELSGFLVCGLSPRLAFDDAYERFLALLAAQVGKAIDDARALEEEQRRRDALVELDRAKTAFFANVSHELRTPLTLMLAPVEELLARSSDGDESDDGTRELLQLAQRSGSRLQRLVNPLLDFSRIEAGRMQASFEPVDLAACTADLASVFRAAIERAGLGFEVRCEPLPQPVHVDRGMWEKIVFNLVGNALKYTHEGGIEVRLAADAQGALLTVSDTGIGIAPAEQAKVFERFYRVEDARGRSIEGSGIGLALVAELVRLHGGSVALLSEPGRGSSFSVRLRFGCAHLPPERLAPPTAWGPHEPAREAGTWTDLAGDWLRDTGSAAIDEPAPAGAEAPAAGSADGAAATTTVLVADDNADMRAYLRRLLARRHRVLSAADGHEALRLAREAQPDLVLSDVMMPGLDGFALLRALRADPRTRPLPLVLLSARAGDEARLEGLQAGADDYLVKPFQARELLARIDGVIALARTRAELAERDAALRQSESRHRFLLTLHEHTQALRTPREVLSATTRLLGKHLGVDRCLFATVTSDEDGVEVLADGVWVRDAQMPVPAGRLGLVGYGREQLALYRAGLPYVVEDVETDERLVEQRPALRALQTRANVSVGLLKDGRLVAVFGVQQRQPRAWQAEDVALMQGVASRCWDAIERARTQQELLASGQRLAQMADAMPQIVYVNGPDGRLEFVNRQWREFTGLVEAGPEVMPRVIHPDDRPQVFARWQHAMRSQSPFTADYRLRRSDGEYRWFLTRAEPAFDEQGRLLRWYGTSTNVDFQKRHADALKAAHDGLQRADRRKDEFLATLAHELRNPLAPLRNSLHLLQMQVEPAVADRLHAMMKRQLDHLVRLVDDLLEVARISEGKIRLQRAPLPLAGVLASAVETARPLIDQAGHRLEIDIVTPEPMVVDGDAVRLAQVFANLLNNAAKYTERGGLISLSAKREGDEAVVSVRDNGVGIDAELLPRVFDLFAQAEAGAARAQGGLGIGLSLVRNLLAMHGASVSAHSDGPGRGSSFVVRLPLVAAPAPAHGDGGPPVATAEAPGTIKVLVCDDNRDAADSLGQLLELLGASVTVVHEGAAALKAAARLRPRLVLLDLGMPQMDGFEVARELRRMAGFDDVTLVAVSGWGQARDRERTRAAGFDEHLVKPIDLQALQRLIAATLSSAESSDAE